MFLTGIKSWPDVFTLYRSVITLRLDSKQEQTGCKIQIFSFDKTKDGDKMGCHGTSRVLMAVTQWHHYQDTMCLLREDKESPITRAPTGRSLILRWFLQPSVCVSLHQCLNLWAIKCKNQLGQEGENMTELSTCWSPGGELRWAVYDFMNVPLEVFSLPCINLSSLPAAVELGDAFVFRHSSDLHSTAALSPPYTSAPTAKHRTTEGVKHSGTKLCPLWLGSISNPMVLKLKWTFLFLFLLFIYSHMNIGTQRRCCWMDDSVFGRKHTNMQDK